MTERVSELANELPLLLLYDGDDPKYVQRKLEEAAAALRERAVAPQGVVLVPRRSWMGNLADLQVGDKVRVRYKDGSGTLTGTITTIWELPHPQFQVNNGWCFHKGDEILEHECPELDDVSMPTSESMERKA